MKTRHKLFQIVLVLALLVGTTAFVAAPTEQVQWSTTSTISCPVVDQFCWDDGFCLDINWLLRLVTPNVAWNK